MLSVFVKSGDGEGASLTGKSFRFVRACERAVWLPSGIRSQKRVPPFSLFPFVWTSFPFPILVLVN